MIPITQIATNLKMSTKAISTRFENIGIRGKLRSKTYFYTQEQVNLISFKKHKNPSYPALSHRSTYNEQVKIIELYLSLDKVNVSEISRILDIEYLKCYKAINQYKKRECLIIQSKL